MIEICPKNLIPGMIGICLDSHLKELIGKTFLVNRPGHGVDSGLMFSGSPNWYVPSSSLHIRVEVFPRNTIVPVLWKRNGRWIQAADYNNSALDIETFSYRTNIGFDWRDIEPSIVPFRSFA